MAERRKFKRSSQIPVIFIQENKLPIVGLEGIKPTDNQLADEFLPRWMENIDPLVRYERYFRGNNPDATLRMVKNAYKKFVLSEEWDWEEMKFMIVLDHIFEYSETLSYHCVEKNGKLFDTMSLPIQKDIARRNRRRERI